MSIRAIRRWMCKNQGIPWPGTGKDQRGRKNGGPAYTYRRPKRKAVSILNLFKKPGYPPVTDRRKRRVAKRAGIANLWRSFSNLGNPDRVKEAKDD